VTEEKIMHYRKFDGKKYELYASTNTIADVKLIKEFIHKRDPKSSVRTVKHPKSISSYKYGVYVGR
jgi:hypothetical protein